MRQAKPIARAFALILAFSVLPLLLIGVTAGGTDGIQSGSLYSDSAIAHRNILSPPAAAHTGELLPIGQARITDAHSVRRPDRPQPFGICFNAGLILVQLSLRLLAAAFLLISSTNYSHKSIIAYMHDKDGRKDALRIL